MKIQRAFKCSRNVINVKIVEERLGKDNFARKQTEFVNQTIKNVRVNDNVPVPLRQTSEDEENQKLTRLEIKA